MVKNCRRPGHFRSRILSALLSLSLTITLASAGAGASAAAAFGYWSDYASEPVFDAAANTYTIRDASQLAWLSNAVDDGMHFEGCKFRLAKNIDLSAHFWVPIGAGGSEFRGYFDGDGFTISGLRIGTPSNPENRYSYVGLFGLCSNAFFTDVVLTDLSVYCAGKNASEGSEPTSMLYVGAMVANNYGVCGMSNCRSSGLVIVSGGGSGCCAGGLFGFFDGPASDCRSDCEVRAWSSGCVGGLGGVAAGSYTRCFASGNVTGGDGAMAGGLFGSISGGSDNRCRVTQCFAVCSVSCGSEAEIKIAQGALFVKGAMAGGLAGYINCADVSNCYVSCPVTGGAKDLNGDGGLEVMLGAVAAGSDAASYDGVYWNSGAGLTRGDSALIATAFDPSSGGEDRTTALTTDFMRSQDFLRLLNSSKPGTVPWEIYPGHNGGFPTIAGTGAPLQSLKIASPTASAVLVNGARAGIAAYNIEGYNYLRLRDLTSALSGTRKQFGVGWDSASETITISTSSGCSV